MLMVHYPSPSRISIRHPLCPQVENHDMTDIREKTFRLTQFARCAG